MKKLMSVILILISVPALAKDFDMKEICKPGSERLAFAEKMRDKVVDKFKSIKKNSEEWKKFEQSEMFEWIVLTYPEVLPSYAARPVAQACADSHVQYLAAKDDLAAEKLTEWKDCIATGYRETPPDTFTALVKCYETPTPSK